MTRPLNYTVKEILPALLSKAKTQTIRKAWNEEATCFWCNKKFKSLIKHCKNNHEELSARSYDYEKAATYKVGDKVKIYWNQRSKYKLFCKNCGKPFWNKIDLSKATNEIWCGCDEIIIKYKKLNLQPDNMFYDLKKYQEQFLREESFYKLLGEIEITEVFKIEMGYAKIDNKPYVDDTTGRWYIEILDKFDKQLPNKHQGRDLYKLDGFSSAEQMFNTLNKMYSLASPKTFWVYRWVWK